jgi:hypothetical protein
MGKWQMGLIRIGDQAEDLLRELVAGADAHAAQAPLSKPARSRTTRSTA